MTQSPIERAREALRESIQYYYRLDGCPAESADDPNCICWHDAGTGPLADASDFYKTTRLNPKSREALKALEGE